MQPDGNAFEITDEEWRAIAGRRLAELGLTYDELRERMTRAPSTAEIKLWMLIGDMSPADLAGWRSTLAIHADPELHAALTAPIDDLDPPDEAPVLAAAARRPRRYVRED